MRKRLAAVEGAGAGAAATEAAAAALAAVDEWKKKSGMNLKRALAKQVWESSLMEEYRGALNHLFAATVRQSEALEELRLTVIGLSITTCMIWVALLRRRPGALEEVLSWTRVGRAACIAAMFLFAFLRR